MAELRVVEAGDLGKDFVLNEKLLKLMLNIDGVSLVRDEKTGVISVKFPEVSSPVSKDDGNLLIEGKDGRTYLNDDVVQDAVGRSVAGGLEYDSVLNSLKALVTKLTFNDSPSISFVDSDAAEGFAMSANIRISRGEGNLLEVSKDGLFVPAPAAIKNSHEIAEGGFVTNVSGEESMTPLTTVSNLFGTKKLGHVFSS